MSNNTLFETASRIKLRFDTPKGPATVEQLWDLPLTGKFSLDSIALSVQQALTDIGQIKSFVDDTIQTDPESELRLAILKYVINVRKAERDLAANERGIREQEQRILGLIVAKRDQEQAAKSVEQLEAELAALRASKTPATAQ
jgi:hypothetical protein